MSKEILSTSQAPKAIGPYSQGIKAQGLIFCSGQVGINPGTGKIEGVTAADQARQCLTNLEAVLEAGGAGLNDVVRTTIYLADMGDFASVNEVYASFFKAACPARATFAVKGLPLGAKVEIDCIALAPR